MITNLAGLRSPSSVDRRILCTVRCSSSGVLISFCIGEILERFNPETDVMRKSIHILARSFFSTNISLDTVTPMQRNYFHLGTLPGMGCNSVYFLCVRHSEVSAQMLASCSTGVFDSCAEAQQLKWGDSVVIFNLMPSMRLVPVIISHADFRRSTPSMAGSDDVPRTPKSIQNKFRTMITKASQPKPFSLVIFEISPQDRPIFHAYQVPGTDLSEAAHKIQFNHLKWESPINCHSSRALPYVSRTSSPVNATNSPVRTTGLGTVSI